MMTEQQRINQAIEWYKLGKPYCVSTFIDEVTLTYGYGDLSDLGEWEYEIPHEYLKKDEARTVDELMHKHKKGTRE